MSAGGMWMPPRHELALVRERIAERHEELDAILAARAFRRRFGRLSDEAVLRRVPRGWAPDHPACALLRYRSFTVGRALSDDEVLGPGLAERLGRDYATLTPLVRWLNAALGLPAATRR
jgi:uncharacterized protein (TIGR02453 family)